MPPIGSFRSLSVRQQMIGVVAIMLILCALLLSVYLLYLRPSYGVLFSRLRTPDAAAIAGELDRRKLPYRLADGGATILMPENLIDSTRLSVMSEDLPIKGMTGFELFNKSDMGLTEFAQKINFQRALQGELARTIMSFDGVEATRVHLSMTEPTIFRADRIPPKASVTVITRPDMALDAAAVRGIQRLVASSVPELDVANVAVLDGRGDVVSSDAAPTALPLSPYEQRKKAIEDYQAARIEEALQRSYPPDLIGVAVLADSDGQAGAGFGDTASGPGPIRRERLVVTLSPRTALSEGARNDVRAIVANAIGFDAAIGDVIAFGPPPVAEQRAASPEPSPTRQPTPASPQGAAPAPWTFPDLSISIALAIAAVVGLIVWARSMARDRDRRRRLYVDRLTELLDQGEHDAAHRA